MSPLRIVFVFIAIAAVASQDAVVPEQVFDESIPSDDITIFLQRNAEKAKTNPDAAINELTTMMEAAPTRDISKLEAAIESLINEVKKEQAADKVSSQTKVNEAGNDLQQCGNKPEVDQVKKAEMEDAQKKADAAEDGVKKKSTGTVSYDLGDSVASSTAAVTTVNNQMQEIKKKFDALIGARTAARNALKLATSVLESANKALLDSKNQCFCLKKKAFDSLFATLNDATERNHELAHFHTVKCLMTEYKKGNMHNSAISQCKDIYATLPKTKGLDDSTGDVKDTRFGSSTCKQFEKPPNTEDSEGFTLAMRFGRESQLKFTSPYWTNSDLIDSKDQDKDKDADGKFAVFNTMKATQIKGCLPGGCKTYTLPDGASTLKDLFSTTPISSSRNIQFSEGAAGVQQWATIGQMPGRVTSGWQRSGINFDDDQSGYKARVRFGALFNNERSVRTANDAIGFGAQEAGGTAAQQVGAGVTIWPHKSYPKQGTIWIKA